MLKLRFVVLFPLVAPLWLLFWVAQYYEIKKMEAQR